MLASALAGASGMPDGIIAMEHRRATRDNGRVGALILIAIGVAIGWYYFHSKQRAETSARLLSEASYIQGQLDATPGPPDEEKVGKMIDLMIAARPDIVEKLSWLPEDQVGDQAMALALTLFPNKPYTSLRCAAAFGHAADLLRESRQQQQAKT